MILARGVVYVTAHARERYVQRILGIEDEKAIKKYLDENTMEVLFDVWKLFSKSKLYYKSYVDDSKRVFDIHIYRNIVFIVSPNLEMVTLWNIDEEVLAKNKGIHKTVIKKLYANKLEIGRLSNKATKIGWERKAIQLSISNLKDILLKVKDLGDQSSSKLIEEKIKSLYDENALKLKESKKAVSDKNILTDENKYIIMSMVHGYIDEIVQYFNEKGNQDLRKLLPNTFK